MNVDWRHPARTAWLRDVECHVLVWSPCIPSIRVRTKVADESERTHLVAHRLERESTLIDWLQRQSPTWKIDVFVRWTISRTKLKWIGFELMLLTIASVDEEKNNNDAQHLQRHRWHEHQDRWLICVRIGRWNLRIACKCVREWKEKGEDDWLCLSRLSNLSNNHARLVAHRHKRRRRTRRKPSAGEQRREARKV